MRLLPPPQQGRVPVHSWRLAGVCLLVASSLLVAACGGNSNSGSERAGNTTGTRTAWSLPGADLQNSRNVGGPINASNVSTLGVAWTVPITAHGAFGAYATTPVVANWVLYTQDLESNVQAINLASGKVLWTHKYNSANEGPNGVTFNDGTLYGATNSAAFALQASDGKQLWMKTLSRNGNEGIDMAPGYNDGTVYVSTVPGNPKAFYAGDGQAVLWAMDAKTGSTKWKFDQVPANLWSAAHKNINSGGGMWNPPTFDSVGDLYMESRILRRSPGRRSSRGARAGPDRISTPTRSSSSTAGRANTSGTTS
jgi:glucose dehydrogenase